MRQHHVLVQLIRMNMLTRIVCVHFTIHFFRDFFITTFCMVDKIRTSFIVSFFMCTLGYSAARELEANIKLSNIY